MLVIAPVCGPTPKSQPRLNEIHLRRLNRD